MKNKDPQAPWYNPIYRDHPDAPHNKDPDNLARPWNKTFWNPEDLTEDETGKTEYPKNWGKCKNSKQQIKFTMEKIANEKGELVLKRTDFMNWVAITSYHRVAIMAIVNNVNLDKAYEQAISEFMLALYKSKPLHRKQIFELLNETGVDGITPHAFDKAAELILNSHIPEKIT